MENNKTEPNQPAFACVDGNSHLQEVLAKRLELVTAMQGLQDEDGKPFFSTKWLVENSQLATISVALADELIKALNKGENK